MRRRRARTAHALALLAVAVLWPTCVARGHLDGQSTWLDRLEHPLLDLRFLLTGPRPAPEAVVVVAIDDEAIWAAGGFPLPRQVLAQLVQAIARARPRAIGLDILLLDRGSDGPDAALEAALRESRSIIACAAVFSQTSSMIFEPQSADRVLQPLARFAAVSGLGFVNISTDHGGVPRHLPQLIAQGERLWPGLPLRVAATALQTEPVVDEGSIRFAAMRTQLDLGQNLTLRFYGPRGSVHTLSAARLLLDDGSTQDALRDRIVMVGATAIGAADTFATPYDPILPGVEVLATGLTHLVAGDGLVRNSAVRRVDALAAIGLSLAAASLLIAVPPGLTMALISLGIVGWLAASIMAFASGVWLSVTVPLAAVMPVIALGLGGRLVLDRRDAGWLAAAERALRVFHPAHLAARIAQEPAFLAQPLTQDAGIVFLDLSGFTGLSERLGPSRTQTFLKGFQGAVETCVGQHGGTVVAFMGDGAMCVFGLAEPGPEDARRTLAAALDLVPTVRTWLAECREDVHGIDVQVGAHHGEAVVSRLGSDAHQHITASGDSVNTASRLMEVGKSLHAALVVSRDLLAAAGQDPSDQALFEGQCSVVIRGRERPLSVAYGWVRPGPNG